MLTWGTFFLVYAMPRLLEPRQVAPGAYKRWLKESVRLAGRVWMSLLAFSLLVGLLGGWLAHQGFFVGFVVCVTAFGLWQALLLHTAERAAAGKRVTVGDGVDGVLAFWSLPGRQAQFQLKVRLICSVLFYVLFLVVFLLPMLWYTASHPEIAAEVAQQAPPSGHPVWRLLLAMAGGWVLVFFWSWVNQRGGILSPANMLVRKHGLDWDMALALWERAVRLNYLQLRPLYWVFFGVLVAMLWLPVLVFPLEVFWVCLVTVAARDMFEQEEALSPQEARVTQTGLASV